MNPPAIHLPRAPAALARLVLAAGLATAALATSSAFVPDLTAPPARAQDVPAGPLGGAWRTYANGDRVNVLVRDDDSLWSGTDGGGLVRWDIASGTYRQFLAPQDGLLSNVVNDVAVVPDGTVWVATDRGLSRFDEVKERFVTLTTAGSPGMPADVVTAVEPTPDDRLWVGFAQEWDPLAVDPKSGQPGTFRNGGLGIYDPNTGSWDSSQEFHAEVLDGAPGGGTAGAERYKHLVSENITRIEYGSDGILWIGTRPYYVWDANEFAGKEPGKPRGFWVLSGGGLVAREGDRWKYWRAAESRAGCYSNHITDLARDVDGRMWVATAGKGLLVMRNGLQAVGCDTGQAYYTRSRRADDPGLRGNFVWSVDVDDRGRVWVGHGDGRYAGEGIGILTHNGTFTDSSASRTPWQSDDVWAFLDLDGQPGSSGALVSALAVREPGPRYLGTRDEARGDGHGLRRYVEGTGVWTPLRTSDSGLPSNQITGITRSPIGNDVWFSFRNRGVARFDGQSWRSWRMFGPGDEVGAVTQDLAAKERGRERIPVDIATREAFDAAFPGTSRYARIGDDPVLYRVTGYVAQRGSLGPFIDVSPRQTREIRAGTQVFAVDRGPASDASTQIAIDQAGRVWIGGRETVWLGEKCPRDRATKAECWLDGGLAMWDGTHWTVLWQDELGRDANAIPDQEVQSVLIGPNGRVWAGTGSARQSEGDGIGVYDPETGNWTRYDKVALGARLGGNGVSDLALDPETGDVWAAHHAATVCVINSPFGGNTCSPSRTGGGVSKFDGGMWQAWTKPSATLRAFGPQGELNAIVVDRDRGLVWTGGFDGDPRTMHWNSGIGVDAVVNWCPLDCTDDGWQNRVWAEEGEVAALALDERNNLWAGVNRSRKGATPPEAGVKVFDGTEWFAYTPRNSGLASHEITVLEPDGSDMWVGTLDRGVSLYLRDAPPTPTPRATPTAVASPTFEPTPTHEPTPTRQTRPQTVCGPDRWCEIYLPFSWLSLGCRTCPTATPQATPTPKPAVPVAAPSSPPAESVSRRAPDGVAPWCLPRSPSSPPRRRWPCSPRGGAP